MQQASGEQRRAAIALIDHRSLRRSGWTNLLSRWAEAAGMTVEATAPAATLSLQEPETEFRLGILSLGAMPLQQPEAAGWLAALMEALPDTPMVVISDLEDTAEVVAAYRAKARGFIPTSTEPEVALRTLAFIMGGGTFFPPTALFGHTHDAPPSPTQHNGIQKIEPASDQQRKSSLTDRQEAIMAHLAAGQSNKVIAQLLGVREATVKVHVRQLMRKLGASNRTQAALLAAAMMPRTAAKLPALIPAAAVDGQLAQQLPPGPPSEPSLTLLNGGAEIQRSRRIIRF